MVLHTLKKSVLSEGQPSLQSCTVGEKGNGDAVPFLSIPAKQKDALSTAIASFSY